MDHGLDKWPIVVHIIASSSKSYYYRGKSIDLLTRLVAAGFTEYEAKAYLALLREYPATGYQISKQSGVPRSMVYEALGRLHARGVVLETSDGRVTLYRPLPPDVLLDQTCFFLKVLSAYGAPELTAHFCKLDDLLFGNIPGISWERTQTLGRGDECCNFRFCRTAAS